ncbi:hypothetical protein XA68_17374 [Ophiocordyceps unilateralis]|uniref:Ubiquitin-like domain-containing protein n=1 Tax=Ophiocordyceps unilateralis TaxID=268505 RepID=A0A2A9P4Y1_OPHUN|nr:hypothetical protein XA68_17374 [Ophiocordyceps unilateralis]
MKKLPFKPTALRKTFLSHLNSAHSDAKNDDDGLDLFRRSKEMERVAEADRERRLKKKQKQALEEHQGQQTDGLGKRSRQSYDDGPDFSGRGDDDADVNPFSDEPAPPRQASRDSLQNKDRSAAEVSIIDDDGGLSELVTPPASKRSRVDTTPSKAPILSLEDAEAAEVDSPSTRIAHSRPQLETPSRRRPPGAVPMSSRSAPVISLDSDDDSSDSQTDTESTTPVRRPVRGVCAPETPDVPASSMPVDDDEFGEHVRRAEEQRARDKATLAGRAAGSQTQEVWIWITSAVPGARSICFKFLYGKPLRLVRDSWAKAQREHQVQLPDKNDDVILTWRRKKVYNSSNLLSLGIRPQSDGCVGADDFRLDGTSDNRSKVHMEAWTTELFEEMERHEEARRRREAGESLWELDEDEDDEDGTAEGEGEAARAKIRLTLKARGFDDVGLTVVPETTVDTLVTGFRTQRDIGPDRDVSVWFDGERLADQMTMEEAEIDDLDALEVHVK